jgi:Uma2 family endonuclease
MTTVTLLPHGGSLNRADLDEVRTEDGRRYELIDGVLVVSPAPSLPHQRAVGRLYIQLSTACTDEYEVVLAPFAVVLAEDTEMQPDILVARRTDLTQRDLPMAPVLAVEVLSPSTRLFDLGLKRARFEVAGCASYWVVDPQVPALTCWELRDGRYVETRHVTGEEECVVAEPFPTAVRPAELVR